MENFGLFNLVCQVLPEDIDPCELKRIGKKIWWDHKQTIAVLYSLRKYERINWQAYLENNQDVKEAGVDPVLHFVRNGVYEGRKLYSWHPMRYGNTIKGAPKVSVIIPNYNNYVFLDFCLNSVVNQTLKDIEIIIVDDGSTDNSIHIIQKYANADTRIKAIFLKKNESQHMAKKTGVKAATGDYIMFLDSDDSFTPNACEIAYKAISKGYDMVMFNLKIINHAHFSDDQVIRLTKYYNECKAKEYDSTGVLYDSFVKRIIPNRVTNKIFERCMCQASSKEMEDGYFTLAEDYYQFLTLAHNSRRILKINDVLYNACYGIGTTSLIPNTDNHLKYLNYDNILSAIEKYCKKFNLIEIYNEIKIALFKNTFLKVLEMLDGKYITQYFTMLGRIFGHIDVIKYIMKYFINDHALIARKLKYFYVDDMMQGNVKKIGIFYFRISSGGVERTINNMCKLLIPLGYEIHLFLEEKSEFDMIVDESVKIYYIARSCNTDYGNVEHVQDLYKALLADRVDIMIYMHVHHPQLIWDILLFKYMNIPIIGSLRMDFNLELLHKGRGYRHAAMLDTLRCLDKMFCLSISSELYLRIQGIDAVYIPNTIKRYDLPIHVKSANNIVVIARLHDRLKQARACLTVLALVREKLPNVRMIFVGGFNYDSAKREFYRTAQELNVKNNIEVTGWVDDPCQYIDKSKLLLSCSFMEGFPNGIAEAQSRGVPVVMFYLDVMIAKNNDSMIQIAQKDYREAATSIVRLLTDEKERQRLSEIALQKSKEYSDTRFCESIVELIHGYGSYSIVRYYTENDYNTILESMSYYAGKTLPSA